MLPGYNPKLRERLREDIVASGITYFECAQRCINLATQRLLDSLEELAYGVLAEQGKVVEHCRSVEDLVAMFKEGLLQDAYDVLQIPIRDEVENFVKELEGVQYLLEQSRSGHIPCDETTYQRLSAFYFALCDVLLHVQHASNKRMKLWNLKHPEYAGRVDILRAYEMNFEQRGEE